MKKDLKNYLLLTLLLLFNILLFSCKEKDPITPKEFSKDLSISISLPTNIATRVIYSDDEAQDGGKFFTWSAKDSIILMGYGANNVLVGNTKLNLSSAEGSYKATFKGKKISGAKTYRVCYPANVNVGENEDYLKTFFENRKQTQSANGDDSHIKDNILFLSDYFEESAKEVNLKLENSIMKFIISNIPIDIGNLKKIIWKVSRGGTNNKMVLEFPSKSVSFTPDKNILTAFISFIPEQMSLKKGDNLSVILYGDKSYVAKGTTGGKVYEQNKRYEVKLNNCQVYENEDVVIDWVPIKAGSFNMGSPKTEPLRYDDETQHNVSLTKDFFISKYEVTFNQYDAYCESNSKPKPNDEGWGRGNKPVINVSWNDAKEFCEWIGGSLPSEAQWEYACRAGSTTPFSFGATVNPNQANFDGNIEYSTELSGSYTKRTVDVNSYNANAWGLYNMHGNVAEWCADYYAAYPKGNSTDPLVQKDVEDNNLKVVRGGSWFTRPDGCRSAIRCGYNPLLKFGDVGFRVVTFNKVEKKEKKNEYPLIEIKEY